MWITYKKRQFHMQKTGSQWPTSFGMNKRSRQIKKISLKFSAKKEGCYEEE